MKPVFVPVVAATLASTLALTLAWPISHMAQAQGAAAPAAATGTTSTSGTPPYQNLIQVPDFSEKSGWTMPQPNTLRASSTKTVSVENFIYRSAAQITVDTPQGARESSTMAAFVLPVPVTQGIEFAFKFWARSPQNMAITAHFEERNMPFAKSASKKLTLTTDWKEYELRSKVKRDYEERTAQVSLLLATGNGVVELTGTRLYIGKLPPQDAGGFTPFIEELSISGLPPLPMQSVLRNGDFTQDLADWEGLSTSDRCKTQLSSVKDPRFVRYLTVGATPRTEDKPWSISARQALSVPIKKGETIVVRAWMRAAQAGKVAFIVEQNKAPFGKTIDNMLRLSPEWRHFEVRGVAAQDFPAGSTRLSLYLGYDANTIEIANVQLMKLP